MEMTICRRVGSNAKFSRDYKQTDKVFKEHAQVFHNIEEFLNTVR